MNISVNVPDQVLEKLDKYFSHKGLEIQDYDCLLRFLLKDLVTDVQLIVGGEHEVIEEDVFSWTSREALLKNGCKEKE